MILVLGAGLLGLNLYNYFKCNGIDVKIFSRHLPIDVNKYPNVEGEIESIADHFEVFQNVKTIIHCMHTTVPATSVIDPYYDTESNVLPLLNILDMSHKYGVENMIYVSSGGAVYGEQGGKFINENESCFPKSSYGVTKLMNEQYLRIYQSKFINTIIIRPSNIYGRGQKINRPQGIVGHILNSSKKGKMLEVWGGGDSYKDYLHIDDFVEAIFMLVIKLGSLKGYGIYNLSSHQVISINEMISFIEGLSNQTISRVYLSSKEFDVENIKLDSTKFRLKFHWAAKREFYNELKYMYKEFCEM